jgi:glycosyltransferase involved in cell wall biosynthesis
MTGLGITAVITTHRRPEALGRALDSVLAQTQLPAGVLVVEDGADPATAAVVTSRRGLLPIRHLRVAPGRVCPAASRNLALREATTSHVAFLDDDDAWAPDKSEVQMARIGHAVLSCGNAMRSDGRPYFPEGHDRVIQPGELRRHNPVITSTAIVCREDALTVGGFSEKASLRGVEDFDMWLRLADRAGAFVYLGSHLALYECGDSTRLSGDGLRGEVRLARVRTGDVARHPLHPMPWGAAARSCVGVGIAATQQLMNAVRG